jgi:hypothetical protein
MWQSFIYGMHWRYAGKMYYDEVHAESEAAATAYFNEHKRDDVILIRVEFVGPDEGGVPVPGRLPMLPMDPLVARRRLDRDDNAR